MGPRWKKARWSNRFERQRETFAVTLELEGHPDLAVRARHCCKFVAISALDCCAAEQRLRWSVCGIRGCPVCAHVAAREEFEALWSYARHLRATQPGVQWRHVVLTSPNDAPATVEGLRHRCRELKSATKKLWAKMRSWKERRPVGMRCYLEGGASGMVHVHCLWLGHWLDAAWLKRTWAELTGWGYIDEENGGELRAVCHVSALYHYRTTADRRAGKKTIGAHRASFREFGKYICSPKAGPELGARMSLALEDAPRSWGYGCFVGLRKAREAGELLEGGERGVQLQRDDELAELPEVCPHCGTVHPQRRCTPFLDVITGAFAFQKMRPVLRLLDDVQAARNASAFLTVEAQHKRRKAA